jgi:hypothetical protein
MGSIVGEEQALDLAARVAQGGLDGMDSPDQNAILIFFGGPVLPSRPPVAEL